MSKPDPVAPLFAGKSPLVFEIYEQLLLLVRSLGEFGIEAKKTSIHLTHGTAFAGVHPKKAWLDLTLRSSAPLPGDRLRNRQQVSKNRWHQDVRLASPQDIDAELLEWLRAAYDLTR